MDRGLICKALEEAFNKIYKEYLNTNDNNVLSIIKDLINVIMCQRLSFNEIKDKDKVIGIKIFYREDFQLPEDSYFLDLENIIFMNKIGYCEKTPIIPQEYTQLSIDDVKTPKTKEIHTNKKPKRMKTITVSDFSGIDKAIIDAMPHDVVETYKLCGYKNFLKGETVTNTTKNLTGKVMSFFIDHGLSLCLNVDVKGKHRECRWSIRNCVLHDKNKGTNISIKKYIEENIIPNKNNGL